MHLFFECDSYKKSPGENLNPVRTLPQKARNLNALYCHPFSCETCIHFCVFVKVAFLKLKTLIYFTVVFTDY